MSNQPDYKSRCNHWLVTNLNQPSEPIKKCVFCRNLSYDSGRLLDKTVRLAPCQWHAQTGQIQIKLTRNLINPFYRTCFGLKRVRVIGHWFNWSLVWFGMFQIVSFENNVSCKWTQNISCEPWSSLIKMRCNIEFALELISLFSRCHSRCLRNHFHANWSHFLIS